MSKQRSVILVKVSGEDKPGLTSSLTAVLSQYNINILDIGQAVIHNTLSLGFLIEVPPESESAPILKDVLFKGHQLGVDINFTPISTEKYHQWVSVQACPRYIVTVLGRKLTARQIAQVTEVIYRQGFNIDIITRLSGRIPLSEALPHRRACVELALSGTAADDSEMKAQLMQLSQELEVDIAFQVDDVFRRNRRLVCFDMDSTLIQTEVIVDLARAAGVGDQVQQITEAAMRGELDFKQSFLRRIALLKGLDQSVMERIAQTLPVTEGAERLISTLKGLGYKTAIISGGFTYFGHHLQQLLGIDHVFANQLEIIDGKLSGRHLGEVVDGERKASILRTLAQEERVSLSQVIAIGDGANDLPMLKIAGLGIAFHAKPVVKQTADHAISTLGLDGVLYLLGFRDRELLETSPNGPLAR